MPTSTVMSSSSLIIEMEWKTAKSNDLSTNSFWENCGVAFRIRLIRDSGKGNPMRWALRIPEKRTVSTGKKENKMDGTTHAIDRGGVKKKQDTAATSRDSVPLLIGRELRPLV